MTTARPIFEGELGEILLPDLLTFLDMLNKTGTLELRRDGDLKRIFWALSSGATDALPGHGVEIVFADSSAQGERMPEYLCRNGWITVEALAAARTGATSDEQVIKALIVARALDPRVLPKAVRCLVLDIVYSLFEWRSGTFRFLLSKQPHGEKVVLKTSVSNIIMEGSRRLDEWKRIRESFPSDDIRPARDTSGNSPSVKLPPLELEVLQVVDGRKTINDLVRGSEYDQFTVLNALVTLLNAGAITLASQPASDSTWPGDGLTDREREQAAETIAAFNNIFAGLWERISRLKGEEGRARYAATITKPSFQRGGLFAGVEFLSDGRLPAAPLLAQLTEVPVEERIGRLKGSLDRLLAQQVVQIDTSYPPDEKKAVSDLIAHEKSRLSSLPT